MLRISASYSGEGEPSAVVVVDVRKQCKCLLYQNTCYTLEEIVNCIVTYYLLFNKKAKVVLDETEKPLIDAVVYRLSLILGYIK